MSHRYNTPWWASEGDGPLGSGPDNPQLKSQSKILERLCESGPVYAVETRYGGRKYGKVEVKGGRILINSFQIKEPDSQTNPKFISFPELLSRFNNGSSELPKTVFLRVTPIVRWDSFEVIIETEGLTPRSKNFVLLCSALKGRSYKELPIIRYHVQYLVGSAPHPVVEGIRSDDPKTILKEGGVYGYGEVHPLVRMDPDKRARLVSWFWVYTESEPAYSLPKIGSVVSGLQRLKDLPELNCIIMECGLVI